MTTNSGKTNYNSLQVELRRRLVEGLQFQTSYVFGNAMQSTVRDAAAATDSWPRHRHEGDVTHAFKANVVYDLPFGHGRRFGGNASGVVDRIIGGWQVGVYVARSRAAAWSISATSAWSACPGTTRRTCSSCGSTTPASKVWMLPQDVIDNTIKAFSVSATSANGYSTRGAPTGTLLRAGERSGLHRGRQRRQLRRLRRRARWC